MWGGTQTMTGGGDETFETVWKYRPRAELRDRVKNQRPARVAER